MAPPIVTRFLISLDENKWLGIILFALVTGASVVVALTTPEPQPEEPQILSVGRLSISSPVPTFTVAGQELRTQGQRTNLRDLISNEVLDAIATRVQLNIRDTERAVAQLISNLPESEADRNRRGEESRIITLRYGGRAPEESQRLLQVFMEELVNESYRINTAQLQNRIGNLETRLNDVRGDLKTAEERFYSYLSNEGALLLSIQDGSLFAGITGAEQQKRELDIALSGINGEIRTLENQLRLSADEAFVSSALSADPIIASLRAQILQNELELERFSRDLRDDHPNIVELKKQKATNEKLLQERTVEVIGDDGVFNANVTNIRQSSNLDPTRAQLAARLINLQSERNALLEQFNTVSDLENTLRQEYELFPERQTQQTSLIQQLQSQRILYETISSALIDARSAEAEADSSLTIVQPAFLVVEPTAPVQPGLNPVAIVAIGFGLGLASAFGVIFLLATLDERLHTPQELREFFADRGIPVLSELPQIGTSTSSVGIRPIPPILFESNYAYLPFYERFRSNIRRLGGDNTKVVMMMSVSANEGKSVSAYNLAIASANAGKRTLLVELDLRDKNPRSRKFFNLEPTPEAMANPISYYDFQSNNMGGLDSLIQRVIEIPNFSIAPSPGFQPQPAAIIESSEVKSFLKYVRSQYDFVVIDTPSLSSCNDALLLEPYADGIVLVTQPGKTFRNFLETTIDEFIENELPVIGAVINKVEMNVNLTKDDDTEEDSSIFTGIASEVDSDFDDDESLDSTL